MTRRKNIFLAMTAGILALLLGAEIYCRRNHPDPEPKLDLEKNLGTHWMAPYTMYTRFSYPERKQPRAAGEFRVVLLGGSTVERSEPSIPELVQQEFAKNGRPDVRVLNYGVEGQKSPQELVHLVLHVADLQPDLVVAYNGASDIIQPIAAEPRPGFPYNFYEFENNPLLLPATSYPLLTLVAYGSNLARHRFYDFFEGRIGDRAGVDELRARAGYDTEPWREKIADVLLDNMVKANRFSESMGARFVWLLQPLVYYKDPVHPQEEEEVPYNFSRRGEPPDYREVVGNHASKTREYLRARVRSVPEEENLAFIDLSDMFDGREEPAFLTYMYLTPDANRLAARRIYESIMPYARRKSAL